MKFLGKFAVPVVACFVFSALVVRGQDNENRVVKVINEASRPIYQLYVSNVDQSGWGPDQLGLFETVDIDHYRMFNMDDGSGHCLYDIMAVLSDNRTAITRRFNVCSNNTWTVVDD